MEGKTNPSKLLLIDDDKLVLESFKAILRKEAYQVFGVKSGTEALELLKQKKFDLILVDLMMEDMDGLDILKEVKRIDPHVVVGSPTAPCVCLSEHVGGVALLGASAVLLAHCMLCVACQCNRARA